MANSALCPVLPSWWMLSYSWHRHSYWFFFLFQSPIGDVETRSRTDTLWGRTPGMTREPAEIVADFANGWFERCLFLCCCNAVERFFGYDDFRTVARCHYRFSSYHFTWWLSIERRMKCFNWVADWQTQKEENETRLVTWDLNELVRLNLNEKKKKKKKKKKKSRKRKK